jgi:hypothetical protein
MKKLLGLISIFVFILSITPCWCEIPQLLNYQGMLKNSEGQFEDTTLSITFAIYPDSQGITQLWSEIQPSVKVEDGIFNVLLGSISSVPDSVFTGDVRYLGVKVGADPELSPRTPIVSMAYAYRSRSSDEATTAETANTADHANDSDMLDGKLAGNADGNIPVNNGLLNANLNADYLDGFDSQSFFSPVKQVIRDTMHLGHAHPPMTKQFSPTIDPSKSIVLLGRPHPVAAFSVHALYPDSITIGANFGEELGFAILSFQIIEYK